MSDITVSSTASLASAGVSSVTNGNSSSILSLANYTPYVYKPYE